VALFDAVQTDGRTDRQVHIYRNLRPGLWGMDATVLLYHLVDEFSNFRTWSLTLQNEKLGYCWETVRRESMPRIAKMDVEMTT